MLSPPLSARRFRMLVRPRPSHSATSSLASSGRRISGRAATSMSAFPIRRRCSCEERGRGAPWLGLVGRADTSPPSPRLPIRAVPKRRHAMQAHACAPPPPICRCSWRGWRWPPIGAIGEDGNPIDACFRPSLRVPDSIEIGAEAAIVYKVDYSGFSTINP